MAKLNLLIIVFGEILNKLHRKKVVGRWSANHLPTTYRPPTDYSFYGAACSIFPVFLFCLGANYRACNVDQYHSKLEKPLSTTGPQNYANLNTSVKSTFLDLSSAASSFQFIDNITWFTKQKMKSEPRKDLNRAIAQHL